MIYPKINEPIGGFLRIFFLMFTPKLGEDFQFDPYFSDGLRQTTNEGHLLNPRIGVELYSSMFLRTSKRGIFRFHVSFLGGKCRGCKYYSVVYVFKQDPPLGVSVAGV